MSARTLTIEYDDKTVRQFFIAAVFWGLVALAAGVLVALQMAWWPANLGLPWTTFGRLRPLHTNAAIFAFVGNMMFCGIYYSLQRLLKARTASDFLSKVHFWGWQLIIVLAAITLPLGLTRGKEYAELIWPINVLVAVVWVIFGANMFWTIAKRREKSLYVAIWFYIATVITVALLYVVNHLSLPTSLLHSYPIFSGVQDALVQWWYGHNAVAFFLTTPILGIMYYFMPKACGRPVYSYRLSIIHFWALIFVYIWAGPHHLLNTALPTWVQGLGMVFSLVLWAPSWGGMLNGLLTLRGAWDKLRTDPVLKFFAAGVTFYGMATFEGPLLSIRSVNAIGHYTDWIIGHVHGGTLGWNGLMAAGMFYWLAPRLWNKPLRSVAAANLHFWLAFIGILLYVGSMWASGIGQALSLHELTPDGQAVANSFIETVKAIKPMLYTRFLGGVLYLGGFILMIWNLLATIRGARPTVTTLEVVEEEKPAPQSKFPAYLNPPVLYTVGIIFFCVVWLLASVSQSSLSGVFIIIGLIGTGALVCGAIAHFEVAGKTWGEWYDQLLEHSLAFSLLSLLAVVVGGAVQIIPIVKLSDPKDLGPYLEGRIQKVYTPLELAGRDIYVREGCYTCHSQMIRTLVPEVLRYGASADKGYSRLGESIYDHPFQWGSKRTGPDLAREGGLRGNDWHALHMQDPRSLEPDSIMPAYPWLFEQNADKSVLYARINAQRLLGVPFAQMSPAEIETRYNTQAKEIAESIKKDFPLIMPDREIIALIAYLQSLGSYDSVEDVRKAREAEQREW